MDFVFWSRETDSAMVELHPGNGVEPVFYKDKQGGMVRRIRRCIVLMSDTC